MARVPNAADLPNEDVRPKLPTGPPSTNSRSLNRTPTLPQRRRSTVDRTSRYPARTNRTAERTHGDAQLTHIARQPRATRVVSRSVRSLFVSRGDFADGPVAAKGTLLPGRAEGRSVGCRVREVTCPKSRLFRMRGRSRWNQSRSWVSSRAHLNVNSVGGRR